MKTPVKEICFIASKTAVFILCIVQVICWTLDMIWSPSSHSAFMFILWALGFFIFSNETWREPFELIWLLLHFDVCYYYFQTDKFVLLSSQVATDAINGLLQLDTESLECTSLILGVITQFIVMTHLIPCLITEIIEFPDLFKLAQEVLLPFTVETTLNSSGDTINDQIKADFPKDHL